jgi:hypothetical protein
MHRSKIKENRPPLAPCRFLPTIGKTLILINGPAIRVWIDEPSIPRKQGSPWHISSPEKYSLPRW